MKSALVVLLLLPLAAPAVGSEHFTVSASFASATKGQAHGNVAVTFEAKDPDLRINQDPAPRLKLDPAQVVLVDQQPPPPKPAIAFDPATAKSFDLTFPILFPADLAPGVARGTHNVNATVAFFYCSKREAWCRKGTAELTVPVRVP